MFNINFLNKEATDKQRIELAQAINAEKIMMEISVVEDSISSLEKRIENKSKKYTEKEIEGFKASKEATEKERAELKKNLEEIQEVHDSVVAAIASAKNEAGFTNEEKSVRNALRVVACAENNKLYKYALIGELDSAELFQAMNTCHDITTSCETGTTSMTQMVKAAYKTAEGEISKIIREKLSIPIQSDYTAPLKIKLNKHDLRLIHECYVTGFQNDFANKDGKLEFTKRTVKTLITKTEKKDNSVSYNSRRFAECIAKIVIAHMAIDDEEE